MKCYKHDWVEATRTTLAGVGLCTSCSWDVLKRGGGILTLDSRQTIHLDANEQPIFTNTKETA